jgi:ABC-type dipeptide/oligopeptide/nickel transport system permease component
MVLRFIARRLAGALVVLLAVSFLTFALLDVVPGDAAQTLVGDTASAAQMAQLRQQMGLDRPLLSRYGSYLSAALLHGDLGRSLISGRAVTGLLAGRFRYTLALALAAMGVALVIGFTAGAAAAARPGSAQDAAVMAVTGLGISLPTYWVALLLTLLFSLRWGWLPVVGAGSVAHGVLPTVTLAFPTAAMVARLVRANLLDVQGADYVRTAQAKGLPRRQVWARHVLRNSLIPVVTLLGLHLGHLLGGAFVVETIYAWPGLGRLVVQSVFDRDFPVLVGAVLMVAVIYQVLNFLADVCQAWLDPRVRHEAL